MHARCRVAVPDATRVPLPRIRAAMPETNRLSVLCLRAMQVIRTTVRNGRIVVDEPTTLPEGHEIELRVLNDDGMSEDERQRLHASIARGIRDGHAGREMDLDSFMDQLDAEP
jgi:hypothetical protein